STASPRSCRLGELLLLADGRLLDAPDLDLAPRSAVALEESLLDYLRVVSVDDAGQGVLDSAGELQRVGAGGRVDRRRGLERPRVAAGAVMRGRALAVEGEVDHDRAGERVLGEVLRRDLGHAV